MPKIDDDAEEFVLVECSDKQQLVKAWKQLPIQISFDDFCQKLSEVDPVPTQSRYQVLWQAANGSLWCLRTGWTLSGYASAALTLLQYRSQVKTALCLVAGML
jgi:hypothetical protein